MTKTHMTFRVDAELRDKATQIAKARGESVSNDVLRPALQAYVLEHGKETADE